MKKLVYILLITVCWACVDSTETEKHQYKRDNVIQVRDKIKEIDMDSLMFSSVTVPYIIDNYLLIADFRSYDHLIHLFNKNTFRYITSIAYKGQGPGEIANMGYIGIDSPHRKFDVTDYGKQTIFSYNLDSVLANPLYMPEEKLKIYADKILNEYQYINDSLYMGLILEPIGSSDYKVSTGILNINNGQFRLMPYLHPAIEKKRVSFDVSTEYGLYVECYHGQNLMTICTLDGKLKYNIYGGNDWKENQGGETEYFQQVAFIDDKIFALYLKDNGHIVDPKEGRVKNQATKFLVFDLNGDYLATLETKYRIRHFCYDKANNRIILHMNDDLQFAYLPLDGLIEIPIDKK